MACGSCDEKKKGQSDMAPKVVSISKRGIDDFVRARASICSLCAANDSGVCTEQKKLTPDKDCDIRVGSQMVRAYCPQGKWGRHEAEEYPKRAKCVQCGGYWLATNELCSQCVNKNEVKRRNVDRGVGMSARLAASTGVGPNATALQREMWAGVRNNPSRNKRVSAFTAMKDHAHFVTLNDLASDSLKLANMLPHDIDAIVGVARSGMTPANMIATMLHLPVLAVRQTKGDIIQVGNGWRMGGSSHIGVENARRVAVIDDTSMTGNSFRAIDSILRKSFKNYVTGAIYVNPLSTKKPDLFVHELEWPHILEWNVFNSVLSPNCATDFDGVICHDCAHWQDDDGDNYKAFIANAIPKYVSRKVPIPLIVTARIERYRNETVQWLNKHGIKFHNLVMHPAKTLRERQRDDIAAFKARHFERWAKKHHARPSPSMFIESDDAQSRRISELTGRLVVCPTTASCYGNPKRKG